VLGPTCGFILLRRAEGFRAETTRGRIHLRQEGGRVQRIRRHGNPPREKVGNLYLPKFRLVGASPSMASVQCRSFRFRSCSRRTRKWGTPAGATGGSCSPTRRMDRPEAVGRRPARTRISSSSGTSNIETARAACGLTGKGLQMPAALKGKSFGIPTSPRTSATIRSLNYPEYPENFSNQRAWSISTPGVSKELFPDLDKAAFTFQMSITFRCGCRSTPT